MEDKTTGRNEDRNGMEPGKTELFLHALDYGFSQEEIITMLHNGALNEETLPAIVQQKIDDNTSEIQA